MDADLFKDEAIIIENKTIHEQEKPGVKGEQSETTGESEMPSEGSSDVSVSAENIPIFSKMLLQSSAGGITPVYALYMIY